MARHADAAAIRIRNRYAALHAARLDAGPDASQLPDAPFLHLFVARGRVDLEGAGVLEAGDAVRFTATGGQRVTGVPGDSEGRRDSRDRQVLVWEMHATLG